MEKHRAPARRSFYPPARRTPLAASLVAAAIAHLSFAAESPIRPPTLQPLSPGQAAQSFHVAEDLVWEQILAEPDIAQPVFLTFDERGRLWVVEYRQYPSPAGIKLVSHDNFWRSVYDKVPPPPPHHFRGADRITIHEDTDGNGTFETHKTFVDGLNIATSVAFGRGGVFVLNPPYLLFYADHNRDDVPDGDPEVLLSGFGLEDTHSVANSLRWGPDGWLYGCQGSTVTGNILVHGADGKPLDPKPVYSQGQNIWRYHPSRRLYEIFSEGGGNAFGLEFDNAGRAFSGHNGGNTRGFHYHQGAYLQKGFDKHGPLSNPFAFGYFPPMAHPDVDRFTHTFIIYEGENLPPSYSGKLIGVEPLQGRVVLSEIKPTGQTFRTRDISYPVTSEDSWFRPVDIKLGPDGAVYVADWYDRQVNHFRNHEGQMDASNGRVYRLRAKARASVTRVNNPFLGQPRTDLAQFGTDQLLALLTAPNQAVRQLAQRLLADRGPSAKSAVVDSVRRQLAHPASEFGATFNQEWLWALHGVGGLSEEMALALLRNPDHLVRLWTVRLVGDQREVSPTIATRLVELAAIEPNLAVRGQLAATAKRLPVVNSLPVLRALFQHDLDADDARQPLLLWWALEEKCTSDRRAVVELFKDPELWRAPLVQQHLLARLCRRFAAAGSQADLLACAQLFTQAPDHSSAERLLRGFEEAFQDRAMPGLPAELTSAMTKAGAGSIWLAARTGQSGALEDALRLVANPQTTPSRRLQLIPVLADQRYESAVPILLNLLRTNAAVVPAVQAAAVAALGNFDSPSVAEGLVAHLAIAPASLRPALLATLTSRSTFAEALLRALNEGRLTQLLVTPDARRRLEQLQQRHPTLRPALARVWPERKDPTPAELETEIHRVLSGLQAGTGNPYAGRKLFRDTCAACHRLFGQGANIGPELTAYPRHDLESMVLNVVHPTAEIREGYQGFTAETKEGRSLTGFIVEQDALRIVLRGLDGQNTPLNRADLVSLEPLAGSLMPEGLLSGYTPLQLRDLFAYLRSSQPLSDAKD